MTEDEKKALAALLRTMQRTMWQLHQDSIALIMAADHLDPPDLPEPNRSSHQS